MQANWWLETTGVMWTLICQEKINSYIARTKHDYCIIVVYCSLTSSACLARMCGSSPSWVATLVSSLSCRTCSRVNNLFSFLEFVSSLWQSVSWFCSFLILCSLADSSRSRGENGVLLVPILSDNILPFPAFIRYKIKRDSLLERLFYCNTAYLV